MGVDIKNIKKSKTKSNPKKTVFESIQGFLTMDLIHRKLTLKKKHFFFSELQLLLNAGIDLKSALEVLIHEQEKQKDKILVERIYEALLQGDSLSKGISSTQKFSLYDYYSIKMGEQGGKLGEVVKDLSAFYTARLNLKRQVISALTYPALVILTTIGVVLFLMNFLVPMFEEIFQRADQDLPQITQLVISLSSYFKVRYVLLFTFVIFITVLFLRRIKNKWFKLCVYNLILRLPVVGGLIKSIQLEKVFQSLVLLLSSQVNLLSSVVLVKKIIRFQPVQQLLERLEKGLISGDSLYTLVKNESLFDNRMIALIRIGEETGNLLPIFQKIDEQISVNLEAKISNMTSLLEPILIIFIGLIVAFVLVAMYLPMFQLGTNLY